MPTTNHRRCSWDVPDEKAICLAISLSSAVQGGEIPSNGEKKNQTGQKRAPGFKQQLFTIRFTLSIMVSSIRNKSQNGFFASLFVCLFFFSFDRLKV